MTQNFSPEEIDKFNKMAPSWWDENGPMKPLHQINPIRVKYILDNLNSTNLQSYTILDIGCGGGILSESLAKLDASVTGIDMSHDAINVAKLHAISSSEHKKLNLEYYVTSLEEFWQKKSVTNSDTQLYDVITCLEMLEHVPDPESIVIHMKKLLKPGGKIFISTLNRNLKSYLLAIVGAEYVLNWLPRGTHEYNKFIKPSELAQILRRHNFKMANISGIVYNIFTRDFKLSKDIDVNYIACIE